jgi:predicted transcriptional regulator
MDIRLNADLQAKLTKLAAQRGRDPEMLAQEAIERFVDYDAWFIAEVERGLAQIERGEVLSHDEVGARLEKLLSDKQSR